MLSLAETMRFFSTSLFFFLLPPPAKALNIYTKVIVPMKKLILVTSPPACGKTYVSMQLSKALGHVVYLDKDTLIPLSKQIFRIAHQEYNRSSDFFEENIRDYEYEVIVNLALEALDYDDLVLINAPFTREIRDAAYMQRLRSRLAAKDARLAVIWVDTSVEVCHQRMIERASSRDGWKLAHWDEYIAGRDFTTPTNIPELIIFKNSSDEEFSASLAETTRILKQDLPARD
jgi:predicted kinase